MLIRNVLGFLCFVFIRHEVNAGRRCPVHWIKIRSSCYRTRYNYAVKNWNDGRFWCQTQGAELAKFNNLEKLNAVTNYQGLLATEVNFWVGLQRIDSEWKWTDHSKVNKSIVEKIKDFTTAYNCIYVKKTGEIIVANCNDRKGILCERPLDKQVRCDPNGDWQSYGEKCYRVTHMKGTWGNAKNICNKLNASISSPQTEEEQFALYDFVQNIGQQLWIGLLNTEKNRIQQWVWSDGTALNTSFWGPDKSSLAPGGQKRCAYIEPKTTNWSASWMTAACDVTSGNIICEQHADDESVGMKEDEDEDTALTFRSFVSIDSNIVPHEELKTWHEADAICTQSGGSLATFQEVYGYVNVWISGKDLNGSYLQTTTPTITTAATTTRRNGNGDDSDENDYVFNGSDGLCPFTTANGFLEGSCSENKTFVCTFNTDVLTQPQGEPPTNPAVVAVAILLVIFVALIIILAIVWYTRKKRKTDEKGGDHEDQKHMEKKNGVSNNGHTNIGYTPNQTMETKSKNRTVSDTDNTYDHSSTMQRPVNNGTNQSIYDHCKEKPEDTYDHTVTNGSQNCSKSTDDYGGIDLDDPTYKSCDRTVKSGGNNAALYDHA